MGWTGIAIFGVTYVLISSRRLAWLPLDRPAAALVGAVACVALGALTPRQATAAIDADTLVLLFAVMGLGAFLAVDGFFGLAEEWLLRLARTRAGLLGFVVWSAGILAALITNDAVAVLAAPLVVRLARRSGSRPLPYLLALATAVNTGSVATLVGNPQNMLCGTLGGLSYRDHLLLMGPLALVGLALNHAWLRWVFRRELVGPVGGEPAAPVRDAPPTPDGQRSLRRSWITLAVIGAVAIACLFDASLPWTAATGFVTLMLVHRHDTRRLWTHVDWSLLLFFCGLFVVVEALQQSGAPAALFARAPLSSLESPNGLALSGVFLVGSNVVSNVPFILVVRHAMASLAHPHIGWELLAMASTFAGNLTLLGSVANIIVAESARDDGGIGFLEHLRVGLPLALVTALVGALWVTSVG